MSEILCKVIVQWKKVIVNLNKNIKKLLISIGNDWCYNTNSNSNVGKGGSTMDLELNAIDVSKYIIDKCTKSNNPISNLQLQKILYYIQRDWVKQNHGPVFKENICAWKFGPVVPEVYYTFCGYGGSRIANQYPDVKLSNKITSFIDPIIEEKSSVLPWDLVSDTHRANGAWDTIYQNGKGDHDVIPLELIQKDLVV